MDSVRSVIESLGKGPSVAKALGLPRSTVSWWIYRKRIPIDRWGAVVELAKKLNVDGIDESLLARLWRRGAE